MDKYFNKNDLVNGYSIIKKIGEGKYGIAYLGIDSKGQKSVIKQLKKEMLQRMGNKVIYEKKTLKSLEGSHFPRYLGSFKDNNREGYLLEYIEGELFRDYIYKKEHRFTREEIYKVCYELLDIVEILQKNNIVHRDIRTPNVIIKKNGELVLIDFGLARFIDGEKFNKYEDYWYIGDFLIHLYYSTYVITDSRERPWFIELNLIREERELLKRLMGVKEFYNEISEIRKQLSKVEEEYRYKKASIING